MSTTNTATPWASTEETETMSTTNTATPWASTEETETMSTTNTATPWASTEETVTAEHKAAVEKAQKELAARTLSKLAELESACKLACIVACIAAPRGSVVDGLAGEAKYNAVTESFEAAFAGLRELIGA